MGHMIFCHKCKQSKKIIGFNRDNPVLSCGHEKTIEMFELEQTLTIEAQNRKMSIEDVRSEYIRCLCDMLSDKPVSTIGHCNTCGVVTILIDQCGVQRCGGNLRDNPGCGMPIILYDKVTSL